MRKTPKKKSSAAKRRRRARLAEIARRKIPTHAEIAIARTGELIAAIKIYRARTGAGLTEAKHAIEWYRDNHVAAPPVRIEGELSQPGVKMTKDAGHHAEVAKLKNRIVQLEEALGRISRGGTTHRRDGKPVVLFVTDQVIDAMNALTGTGYWGGTIAETADELLRMALRKERLL
jgi:hypothetical protein